MFTSNAITVLERRYLKKDESGNVVEEPEDLFRRVADTIAAADRKYDEDADVQATADRFHELMISRQFMPNSPTLMNAGRELGQLSACFVLPVGDSMEEIFDAVKNAAIIHKSGGGTGFAFSRLRPKNATVRSTGGVASGPVSFMKVFNAATEAVKQGGTRRGANMGMLRVDHPDILDFISCKSNLSELTNFNISVALTDVFMEAVKSGGSYDLIDPRTQQAAGSLDAAEVFDIIVDRAWSTGEPGIVFIDRINAKNPVPHLGSVEATNPCGEQPLLAYESCNLGSINLARFVMEVDGLPHIDFQALSRAAKDAVHFLDNVITVNRYPLPQIEQQTLLSRKIGLGVMGFADLLYQMRTPYGSEKSFQMAKEIMKTIREAAQEESLALGASRGVFPAFEGSTLEKAGLPQRNATLTTIAPTGTISMICGASSGIEPVFALSYIRNIMDGTELPEGHAYFEQILKKQGLYSPQLMKRIAEEGTAAHIEEIPAGIRRVFVTSHDISPEAHVKMQAAFQEYTDNAVSKTINFASDATKDDVRSAYLLAWENGLKGLTIYRDGSREGQVLNIGSVNHAQKDSRKTEMDSDPAAASRNAPKAALEARKRPEVTQGITEKIKIGCGNLYVTVNYDDQGICEVFTNVGRAGGCPAQSEATSRLVSQALRSGMDVSELIGQLRGIRCHSTLRRGGSVKVLSCPDAIGRVLEMVSKMRSDRVAPLMQPESENRARCPECDTPLVYENECSVCPKCGWSEPLMESTGDTTAICPDCGSPLEHEGGCNICQICGYSKCG